jgi:hypothetical protein
MKTIEELYEEWHKLIGRIIEVKQKVLIDGLWEDFSFTGWLASTALGAGELLAYLDDKGEYLIYDTNQVVKDTKVNDITTLIRGFHKPAWEVNPGGWNYNSVEGWHPQATEPKVARAKCAACSRADCPIVMGQRSQLSDVVLVGEAPGYQELREQDFFVGRSGQLLRAIEEQSGLAKKLVEIDSSQSWLLPILKY